MALSRPASPALEGSAPQEVDHSTAQAQHCDDPSCQAWYRKYKDLMVADIKKFKNTCVVLRSRYDESKLKVEEAVKAREEQTVAHDKLAAAHQKLQSDHQALKERHNTFLFRLQQLQEEDIGIVDSNTGLKRKHLNPSESLVLIPDKKLKEDPEIQRKLTQEHQQRNQQQAKTKPDADNDRETLRQTVANTEKAFSHLAKYGDEYFDNLTECFDKVSLETNKQEAVQNKMLKGLHEHFETCEKASLEAGLENVPDDLQRLFKRIETNVQMTRTVAQVINIRNDECKQAVLKAKQDFNDAAENLRLSHKLGPEQNDRSDTSTPQTGSKKTAGIFRPAGTWVVQPRQQGDYRDVSHTSLHASKFAALSTPSGQKTSQAQPKGTSTKETAHPQRAAMLSHAAALAHQDTTPKPEELGAVTREEHA